MTIGARDDQSRAHVGRQCVELNSSILVLHRYELRSENTVARQPSRDIANPLYRSRLTVLYFHDLCDGDVLGLAKHRQGGNDRPPRLRRVLPTNEHASRIEPVDGFRDDKERAAGLHHEISRRDRGERIGKGVAATAADDDVRAPRLLQNITRRKVDRAAPFDMPGTILGSFAKLAFQFRHAPLDRSLLLVDEGLGLLSVSEVKLRTDYRRDNPDQSGIKRFGDLACYGKRRVVGSIKRQADHDGRIWHPTPP